MFHHFKPKPQPKPTAPKKLTDLQLRIKYGFYIGGKPNTKPLVVLPQEPESVIIEETPAPVEVKASSMHVKAPVNNSVAKKRQGFLHKNMHRLCGTIAALPSDFLLPVAREVLMNTVYTEQFKATVGGDCFGLFISNRTRAGPYVMRD
ncbi:hypothetical protein GR160_11600 [Flavobacterium sp. Sd200]|uniref:hypothetical protein n=1 Tax=Flavobacterium sp. Sd200 TaxID=2692211 RepID=UPI00136EE4B1|nr:hypothetical protein [Flavobacterium sp. Sd200]MXN91867.1 hypothetical protein [Flavobacterium sp. Sd200]